MKVVVVVVVVLDVADDDIVLVLVHGGGGITLSFYLQLKSVNNSDSDAMIFTVMKR
jgi:hypothetical protein